MKQEWKTGNIVTVKIISLYNESVGFGNYYDVIGISYNTQ